MNLDGKFVKDISLHLTSLESEQYGEGTAEVFAGNSVTHTDSMKWWALK